VVGEPEVHNFGVLVVIQEQVLRLEVAMDDAVLVNVLNSCQNLLHEGHCFLLVEPLSFDDVVEEFATLCVLHDEVDICFGLDDLDGRWGTS